MPDVHIITGHTIPRRLYGSDGGYAITARLLGEKGLKLQNPSAYIVRKLQRDKSSSLYHGMHEGGRVRKGATLPGLTVANLTNAVRDMLSRSAKLGQFADTDAQYEMIKNYWNAVKKWLPDAWKRPRDFIIFEGVRDLIFGS